MRNLLLLLFIIIFGFEANSQNLVPNPSFEDTISGTLCIGPIEGAQFWFNPHGASPDYYTYFPNNCGPGSSLNNPSGFQLPRTGVSYAGIYGIAYPTREYIAVKLTDSLISGECYYAEFYCSLANLSRLATSRMGMFFTNDTSNMSTLLTNIPVTPNIENNINNFLADTNSWMSVNGSFIANGGETFLIIGNFYDNLNSPIDTVFLQSNWIAAYYYIDDIQVLPCDSVSSLHMIPNDSFILYPNPSIDYITIKSKSFNEYFEYEILNLVGQNVTDFVTFNIKSDFTTSFNTASLNAGYYCISIKSKNKVENHKFLKL